MATIRRPGVSTGSVNPFDSDDESPAVLPRSNERSSSVHPSSDHYGNPFDDEVDSFPKNQSLGNRKLHSGHGQERSHDRGLQKSIARHKPTSVEGFDTRNPFDDGGFTGSSEKPKDRVTRDKDLFQDDYNSKTEYTSFDHYNQKQSDPHACDSNPFDDDGNAPSSQRRNNSGKTQRSSIRSRASTLGDSTLKKAQKVRESSANQAHKVKESTVHQAQKLKETTFSAFKSNGVNDGLRPAKDARDMLLTNDEENRQTHPRSSLSGYASTGTRYNATQFQTGNLESGTVQELEDYALQKSKDTTDHIQNCLKVAENIKGDATTTLLTLHQQGEQIQRTHDVAVEIDQHLSAGEKVLGNLGGIFSRTWKPKKTRQITGPMITRNDSFKRRGHHLEQRVALGLVRSNSKGRTLNTDPLFEQSQQTVQGKLDVEKKKQDDALSDLSNVLVQLKGMSMDMGSEISRQNEALDHLQDDVVELDIRIKGANVRGRRLLGK
eukprot:c28719_g1_i1 orf=515-1990(+)